MAMNAAAQSLIALVTGANVRFVIPVYQRPYSWDEEQCLQLWDDVLSVGRRPFDRHFTGSVVWVQDGTMSASGVTPLLLIDGQQRITTLTLLIAALADYSRSYPDRPLRFSHSEIMNRGYLLDSYKPGEDRYKLTLSQGDRATLISLLENLVDSDVKIEDESSRLVENYDFFRKRIAALDDPNVVWDGVQRLDVVSISLDAGRDNPQLIFESMNSTGKDLSSADLIRNFVLMGLPREDQDRLYMNHWRVIEKALGVDSYDEVFDEFVRNYLTVLYAPEPLAKRDVYRLFKRHVGENGFDKDGRIVELLKQMESFAGYYAAITSGAERNPVLKRAFGNLARLGVTVANPLLMSLYEDYDSGAFDLSDFVAMVELLESYFLRRAVCDMPSHSLNKFFPSVIAKLNKIQDERGEYREAFESYLYLEEGTIRRFPTDAEFQHAFETRDAYHFRRAFYLLASLENCHHLKDPLPIEPGAYTIEHIMPQNALANDDWVSMLGADGVDEFGLLVHNIGNLTLTAYNSELSDASFEEKRGRIVGGYENDYLAISRALKTADVWGKESILARARELSVVAAQRWRYLSVDSEIAKKYDAKPERRPQQRSRAAFKSLLDTGLISAGAKLFSVKDSFDAVATVTDSGGIRLQNGEEFNSPSMAAMRVVALAGGSGARNGWFFWRVGADGPVLDELRSQLVMQSSEVLQDGERFRMLFWSGFYDYCSEAQGFCDVFGDIAERALCKGSWISFGLGTSKYHLEVMVRTRDERVAALIYFGDAEKYREVYASRAEIDDRLASSSCVVKWDDPVDGKKRNTISVSRAVDFNNDDWVDLYAWIVGEMWKLRAVMQEYDS